MGTRPLWLAGTVCVPSEPFGAPGSVGWRGAGPALCTATAGATGGPAVRSGGRAVLPTRAGRLRPGAPSGPPRALRNSAVGTWPRPLGHVPAAAFLRAPPRPAPPSRVSLLSSGSQSPKCLLLGPLRKSFARRRAHEPTRRRWQFGRHIGITCGAQGCASGLCPGRSRAPRGAPAHLVLQSSVPGSSQSLALRDERSPGTKAAARGV